MNNMLWSIDMGLKFEVDHKTRKSKLCETKESTKLNSKAGQTARWKKSVLHNREAVSPELTQKVGLAAHICDRTEIGKTPGQTGHAVLPKRVSFSSVREIVSKNTIEKKKRWWNRCSHLDSTHVLLCKHSDTYVYTRFTYIPLLNILNTSYIRRTI